MGPLKISFKSILSSPLTTFLNIVLIAFGSAILTALLLASVQINDKLEANSRDIDLVVGAKGSPLQLILSSIYHMDFPTGNIPLKDAEALARSPMVKRAVPLALGDNYNGFRIAGTDTAFVGLYHLTLADGKFWEKDFEVTIGTEVARAANLKTGDTIYGAHGLSSTGDMHKDHGYVVSGILAPQGNVTDNLVLTNVSSVWKMHDHGEAHHEEEHHQKADHGDGHAGPEDTDDDKEITSLLIQYRSPVSVVTFPRMVNQSTNMQAASPALESARLFSLIGTGVDTLRWFAYLIMAIAALSVFVSLYNSLKERRYDLAVMRMMGASKTKIFLIVILEGLMLTVAGSAAGILGGHVALLLFGYFQESSQARLDGWLFIPAEGYILLAGFVTGVVSSVIPAFQAYRTDISKILAKG